ncbi:MAG: hypothetical protein JNN30_17470 [Rhodanobacteraceae bacterium]|nr:hypothetical protein [Rhodanobacteraceae bacterium]
MPASADSAAKQKTTGSHIARESRGDADSVRLEPVEVMIGAVRDARHESREPASNAPQLPLLDSTALLDDTSSAQQPH